MSSVVLCKICGKRRARRTCPAVEGDICSICCGTEREVSLLCPLTCEYLQEAHRHEKPLFPEPEKQAYPEIDVGELDEHAPTMPVVSYALFEAAMRTSGAIDSDALEALDAEIRTRRTAESGLVYASRPENFVAQTVQRHLVELLDEFEKERAVREPLSRLQPTRLLHALVLLYRLGVSIRNDRPRGRAFLDFLRGMVAPMLEQDKPSSSLIVGAGGLLS